MASYSPSSLCATRYSTLPSFDLSVTTSSTSCLHSSTPSPSSAIFCTQLSPTRPWEEHIQEISRELQSICGSPRYRTRESIGPSPSPSSRAKPPLKRYQSMGCMMKTLSSPSVIRKPQYSLSRTESQDRIFQDQGSLLYQGRHEAPFSHCQRLVVRHEETPLMLNEQLALVCPLKSDDLPAKRFSVNEQRHSHSHVIHGQQTSAKSSVIYKVGLLLDQHKPHDLFVSLEDDRLIRICVDETGVTGCPIVLEEVAIPTEVPLQSLFLTIVDDKWLYVQERSSETMVSDFVGCSTKYLPVMREIAGSPQFDIFLRVPANFDADEVVVKTVDDRVIVTGNKRPVTVGDDSADTSPINLSQPWLVLVLPTSVHFVVSLPLPAGAESRTVSAYFTKPHQLLITGKLRPTLRRYTF